MTDINDILAKLVIEDNVVKLPAVQLDRKDYLQVKKRLEGIGGKWNRKAQGFVFKHGIPDDIANVKKGEVINYKKQFQFFETPPELASKIVKIALANKRKLQLQVLEPSAGQGAIINAIFKERKSNIRIYYYELHDINRKVLTDKFGNKIEFRGTDFTKPHTDTEKYDVIIANPPFSKNQDIEHTYIMYNLLRNGGRMVVITSKHWQIASNRKELQFAEWIDKVNAEIETVPAGTFKQSGTDVETLIIKIDKTKDDLAPGYTVKNGFIVKGNNKPEKQHTVLQKIKALLQTIKNKIK